jgi:protein-tyrosine-phosphatase
MVATTFSQGKFIGYSAGSTPSGKINPFALEIADTLAYDKSTLRSKNWDEFSLPNAPKMDLIITVCDNAAGEACPIWPGHPATAHWGFPDPSQAEGNDEAKRFAFQTVMLELKRRIEYLANLPSEQWTAANLQTQLRLLASH